MGSGTLHKTAFCKHSLFANDVFRVYLCFAKCPNFWNTGWWLKIHNINWLLSSARNQTNLQSSWVIRSGRFAPSVQTDFHPSWPVLGQSQPFIFIMLVWYDDWQGSITSQDLKITSHLTVETGCSSPTQQAHETQLVLLFSTMKLNQKMPQLACVA